MSVFSITYNARKQIMFEKALKEKDSTKAKQILESFPKGQNNSEKIEYLVVLNEGYRAIMNIVDSVSSSLLNEHHKFETLFEGLGIKDLADLEDLKETLDECKIDANEITTLKEKLKELIEYRKISRLEDIKTRLQELENYQSLGEYRDLETQLSELEDLRESVKRLDSL